MAVVIADGVRDDGVREVLGLDSGPSEDRPVSAACLAQPGAGATLRQRERASGVITARDNIGASMPAILRQTA